MQETAKKRIAVICSTDYNSYPVGGMMSFIKDAAPELARHFHVDFWGVDAGAHLDSFTSGKQVFPVRFFGSVPTGHKLIPNMVRVVWQLWRSSKTLLDESYDGIYIHGIPLNASIPVRARPKLINHVHGLTNPFMMQGLPSWRARTLAQVYAWYRRRVVRQSDLVFLAADYRGITTFQAENPAARQIKKIENFCDTSLFGTHAIKIDLSTEGLSSDTRIIVHVGRFAYHKDPLLALEAMHAYLKGEGHKTDVALVMIGDGPLLPEGRALATKLGIDDKVRFLGHRERSEIASWLATSDLYLYTSHANGYPISLAEAAQSGLPIVSTSVTGVHDLVQTGENGVLIEGRDPGAFHPAIAEALGRRAEYGYSSLELAKRYTPEIVLARLCRELADVV